MNKKLIRLMSPMAKIILVKENTKKKEDFGSLLPPREGS
jgi:hypothetical protein